MFQHTAARRRLRIDATGVGLAVYVSTHSRAKAAARWLCRHCLTVKRFNTQPREGGCKPKVKSAKKVVEFQHTAARRRLQLVSILQILVILFQHTAARRRLLRRLCLSVFPHCFNTQPREGGCTVLWRLKDGAKKFQHTAARRRLPSTKKSEKGVKAFQHTAARRRLLPT